MKWFYLFSVSALLAVSTIFSSAEAEVMVKYRGNKAVAIAHLYQDNSCQPGTITGRIVKREFDASGLRLNGFVYEETNGRRGFVNVSIDGIEYRQGMAGLSNASSALQQLTMVGRRFRADVLYCGAAGRMLNLVTRFGNS